MTLDRKAWEGHTPGPWRVYRGNLLRVVKPNASSALVICGVHKLGKNGGKVLGDPIANAHLIAAAPALTSRVEELEAEVARLRLALDSLYSGDGLDEAALAMQSIIWPNLFGGEEPSPRHDVQVAVRVLLDMVRARAALDPSR